MKRTRTVIAIGGREDKVDTRVILKEVAKRVGSGRLVIATMATAEYDDVYSEYEKTFRSLGVKHVRKLDVRTRQESKLAAKLKILDDATAVFFTGGDQLKITSQISDTPLFDRIVEIFEAGGIIAGTSAGASVVCESMLVSSIGSDSNKVGPSVRIAQGLGMIKGLLIDQHFAQRGRMARLLGAVAQNPKVLGVGVDENTAIVSEGEKSFYVLGEGAVYVIDGTEVTESDVSSEEDLGRSLSIHDVKLHVLSQGDMFNLETRRPGKISEKKAETLPTIEELKADALLNEKNDREELLQAGR